MGLFLSCWGHLTLHLVVELLAGYIAGTSFERCNFLLFVVCVLCTKTKFLRFYQYVMALSLYLGKRVFDWVSLMMLPPSCMQLANILGRFQWLTCPRKVSFLTDPISPHVKTCEEEELCIAIPKMFIQRMSAGFINWLASMWSRSAF